MPLNTSFVMPWLSNEPASASFARGASVGSSIAANRQARQALRQRGEQFAEEQARLKEAQQERAQLESRQYAAQIAYQTAVDNDIAKAQEHARMDGSTLDDADITRIHAKQFLRYGPSMGPGYGGALSTILNMPRKEDELLQRQFYQQGLLRSKTEQETGRNVRAEEAEAGRDKRAADLNALRKTLATERATRGFAPPEIGRLVKLHEEALAAGDNDTADIYAREIVLHQAKAPAANKSRLHQELATTLRQQMRAIDSNKKFTQAQKDELKTPLLRQLDQSRRDVLDDLESDLPAELTPEQQATETAVATLDKQIADLEIELKRKPDKRALDFGKDNRKIKLDDLKTQRENLKPAAKTTAPAAPAKRPDGLSDSELLNEAREAIKQGKDQVIIKSMLKAWGVKEEL